jgi:hypothetical protein
MTDAEIEAMFDEALQQSDTGDLGRAIGIYESILSERPAMNRVRMELALANFRSLNYPAAKRLAQEVLDNPDTPDTVKNTIRAFLAEVQKQSKPHLWTPYASLGFIYDDNINVGPGSDTIDVAGGTITLSAGSTPISSGGLQLNAGVGHRYLAPNTYNIFDNQAALAWQSQVSLFRNQYFDDGGDFHLNVISARTGPALLVARKWRAQLNAQVDQIDLGNESLALYTGLTPSLSWYFGGRTSLTASFQAQDRNFTSSANQDRDALYLAARLSFGHRFKSELNPSVVVGTQIFTVNAQTDRRSNEGLSFNAGFNFQPVNNSNVYFSFNWRNRDYDGPEPVFGVTRDEIERRYGIGGNYRLKTDNLLNDLVINLSWTHTVNSSNVEIFEYKREQTVLSVSRSF